MLYERGATDDKSYVEDGMGKGKPLFSRINRFDATKSNAAVLAL